MHFLNTLGIAMLVYIASYGAVTLFEKISGTAQSEDNNSHVKFMALFFAAAFFFIVI